MQQRQIMHGRAARLVTAEEFARIPDDEYHYELVEGRVVRMSPPGGRHGMLATRIGALLHQHADSHRLGVVLTTAGFKNRPPPRHSEGTRHRVRPRRAHPGDRHPGRILAGAARSRHRDPLAGRSACQHSGQGRRLPRARRPACLGRRSEGEDCHSASCPLAGDDPGCGRRDRGPRSCARFHLPCCPLLRVARRPAPPSLGTGRWSACRRPRRASSACAQLNRLPRNQSLPSPAWALIAFVL